MKSFAELFKTKYVELLILLLATNMITFTTTSSRKVIEYVTTPQRNERAITEVKYEIKNLKETMEEMDKKFDAIIKYNNISYLPEKDSIFVYSIVAYNKD